MLESPFGKKTEIVVLIMTFILFICLVLPIFGFNSFPQADPYGYGHDGR